MHMRDTAEGQRLFDSQQRQADWKQWGPYLSERAWGTVREDYSESGDAWGYLPHDHARSRAYRWNEDGLGGVCNRFQNLCLAVGLWNERDPILKERLFGLTGPQGNHGEDVKEYYFYLDNTPTHSYMKMLYKYPQVEYPYAALVEWNRNATRNDQEYELIDLIPEALAQNRYFDVIIEYAKAGPDDLYCRITAINRGPDSAPIHILPQVWFRNTWSWGHNPHRPSLRQTGTGRLEVHERHLGTRWYDVQAEGQTADLLFTENDTNTERLFNYPNAQPYVKDAFHQAVIRGERNRINPAGQGTKAAAHFQQVVPPGGSFTVWVRLSDQPSTQPFTEAEAVLQQRIAEADAFYEAIHATHLTEDARLVQRQALSGLLWSKQYYHYSVQLWLEGDPGAAPPAQRLSGRNAAWTHLYTNDVLSMPDKWEYPWFAAWDLAFHCLPIAMVDPEWAKRQITLMLREWYMHPNGQIPAYEWNFGDVNPPVHAWAAWRVYKITRNLTGHADTDFLERSFHKLLLNFTWWVNRKDAEGRNVFEGGFLGLDNIGIFNRSDRLPGGLRIQQADGTAWMAMYCLNMLAMALELARTKPAYEDVATKFFEHFIYIADAMHHLGGEQSLWSEEDGFFYDLLRAPDGSASLLKTRSFVGLIPLFAVETLEPDLLEQLPHFKRRMDWFIQYRPHLLERIAPLDEAGAGGRRLLSVLNAERLRCVLRYVVDEAEFLSPYGLRSVSRYHADHPYHYSLNDETHSLRYEPAESSSGLFGGNSNWRGPIWFPVNYLMIESLQKFHHYYEGDFQITPPGGKPMTLQAVAAELSRRLEHIFLRDASGRRAVLGGNTTFQTDPHWRDHIPFYEYFHGDNGAGLGASHQTGWTALIAKLLQQE
jgi:hypothetical protein